MCFRPARTRRSKRHSRHPAAERWCRPATTCLFGSNDPPVPQFPGRTPNSLREFGVRPGNCLYGIMDRPMSTRGFTLLEVATALFIVGIMTALLIPLATSMIDANRATQTYNEMATIYTAIMGDPASHTFGYMGDVGKVPDSLMDLVTKPSSNNAGWNGPYINNVRVENGVLYDPYGSPYECYYLRDTTNGSTTPDTFVIISRGADRYSTNTSGTPNTCSTFAGTLPSDPTYANQAGNADNVLFPRVTDNSGLLSIQPTGTLSINISNYDDNSSFTSAPNGTLVPGCPSAFTITVTSVARGTSNDSFTMPNNFGANSVDLPEGLYDVQVTSQTAQGILWEQQVAITPGATASYNLNLSGINSNQTPATGGTTPTLKLVNATGLTLKVYEFTQAVNNSTPAGATIANGTTGTIAPQSAGGTTMPNPCASILVRNNAAPNAIVDSFIMPYVIASSPYGTTYTRHVNSNGLFNLTVTNKNL